MEAVSIIIIAIMAVPFAAAVIIIIAGNLYDRRATRKQRDIHASYFND